MQLLHNTEPLFINTLMQVFPRALNTAYDLAKSAQRAAQKGINNPQGGSIAISNYLDFLSTYLSITPFDELSDIVGKVLIVG